MEDIDSLVDGLLATQDGKPPASEPEQKDAHLESDATEHAPEGDDAADNSQEPALEGDDNSREDHDDAEAPTEDAEPEFDIPDGDKSSRVKLSELKNGYLRQSDYTRKTQEVSEQRKALEAELNVSRQKRDQYDAVLSELSRRLGTDEGERSEADWNALRAQDPNRYATEYTDYVRRSQQRATIKSEQTRVAQERETERQAATAKIVRGEQEKLVAALPVLKDPVKGPALISEIRAFAKKAFGFSDAELDTAYDSRIVLGMHMAMQASKAQTAQKTATQKIAAARELPPPGLKSQQTPRTKNERARADAMKRLEKSGSIDDALDYLLK